MGCFPACFGHLRRDLSTKKVQHQCLSPQHESLKLLPEKAKSLKAEEEHVNPIKLDDISKGEHTVSDHSNARKVSNEEGSNSDIKLVENENDKVEMEEHNLNQGLLVNEKELLPKETSCSDVQQDSCCSSLFTLSIDSRKQFFAAEMGGEKEVSSLLKIISTSSSKHEDEEKGNLPLGKEEQCSLSARPCNEMAVETSLSSWLIETKKSPHENKSAGSSPESENNYGDKQILRAIADINKLNGAVSSTTSCCSGGDQPGVGTVGRYWQQRGATDGEVTSVRTGDLVKC